ncbi:heat shock protein 70 kDa 12A [Ceratobasidium sp. AG-Ba]|nr:heat shock protein 70 kDa 12A [Ceratobasidium sp. AG-Ba]
MTRDHKQEAEPLPEGISLSKIYQDFLVYLMKHTRQFFEYRVTEGKRIWADYGENKHIVLSHPNGWGIQEQGFLRDVAVKAGCVCESKSLTHIRFVSEAEASVHFCMYNSNLHDELKLGEEFIVCDAGGSTVDITAYRVKATSPFLELEERKTSACIQAGAVFIDRECRKHITSHLAPLGLSEDELKDYLEDGVADFEASAKRAFELSDSDYRIKLGGKLTNEDLQIRRGVLTISREHMRSFFDGCVSQILASIRQQMMDLSPKHMLLIGGFGDSSYLRSIIGTEFGGSGCTITVANDSSSKAVADGAAIWFAKLSVGKRATRMQYGTDVCVRYDPTNPEHQSRERFQGNDDIEKVKGKWSQITDKGVILDTGESISQIYHRKYPNAPQAITIKDRIYAWTIKDRAPAEWLFDTSGSLTEGFESVCEVQADLTDDLEKVLNVWTSPSGKYYTIQFELRLKFGGTELLACVAWECDGETHTSPATIVPNALKLI